MCDLQVENHGSVFLLHAMSKDGLDWITDHIPEDAMRFGKAVAIEHRFITDIVAGAMSDGLMVQ